MAIAGRKGPSNKRFCKKKALCKLVMRKRLIFGDAPKGGAFLALQLSKLSLTAATSRSVAARSFIPPAPAARSACPATTRPNREAKTSSTRRTCSPSLCRSPPHTSKLSGDAGTTTRVALQPMPLHLQFQGMALE